MKKSTQAITILLGMVLLSALASAAGLDGIKSMIENISQQLAKFGIAVVTIAILWAGYKIVFAGAALRDIAHILIGGLFIGSASAIATMLATPSS